MCNASDKMQFPSSKETGWNEWTIAQIAMANSIGSVKEERKQKDKEKEKDYYLEWS